MGRYYNGDIEGKFWFAVQSSNAADRFGVIGTPPEDILTYYFSEDDLDEVEAEIKRIEDELGNKLAVIETFFKTNNGYNDQMLAELSITNEQVSEYADLLLGRQIRDCIKENGQCSFDAEC